MISRPVLHSIQQAKSPVRISTVGGTVFDGTITDTDDSAVYMKLDSMNEFEKAVIAVEHITAIEN
ncbi:hypothetical protein [Rhodococcoides fascians]|uniref:hypothetical protein n=1 Tax=Rhodococcoides fascians TaxID=1828 RepID=UPI00050BFF2C|nr:hypothetical protein [Rhodococcus fascians]